MFQTISGPLAWGSLSQLVHFEVFQPTQQRVGLPVPIYFITQVNPLTWDVKHLGPIASFGMHPYN